MWERSTKRALRILTFDIESRPLSFWIPEKPTAEITAIASCWTNDISSMHSDILGVTDTVTMLQNFVKRYNEADIVSGHYIRKFDLPMINGALMEFGLDKLSPKMTCDTRLDMFKKGDIPGTQEYLGEIFDVEVSKMHMSQKKWRTANRLLPEGLDDTRKRVVSDVLQNILIRNRMLEQNLLKPPKMWYP